MFAVLDFLLLILVPVLYAAESSLSSSATAIELHSLGCGPVAMHRTQQHHPRVGYVRSHLQTICTLTLSFMARSIALALIFVTAHEAACSVCTLCHNCSGTGASCIFPLLGVRSYGWTFVATEIDPESVESAANNVNSNQLQQMVRRAPLTWLLQL